MGLYGEYNNNKTNYTEKESNAHSWKRAILFGFMALFASFIMILLYCFIFDNFPKDGYKETVGIVVDNYENRSGGDILYTPIVEYLVDGEIYSVKANWSSSPPTSLGTEVTVFYKEDNPQEAKVKQTPFLSVTFLIVTVLCGTCGIGIIIVGIIEKRKEKKQQIQA